MNHRPASTNRQNSRDGSGAPAKALLSFKGAGYYSHAGEAKREAVNHWILTGGAFDGVLDFASVVADPSDPTMMAPQFDSGDHLQPNDAGYQAMANAIPLRPLLTGAR